MENEESSGDGTHVILDLLDCESKLALSSFEEYKENLINEIKKAGMVPFDFAFKIFPGEVPSYTFLIGLEESHISVHTWPEKQKVNIDIYTCNFSKDNTQGTLDIAEFFKNLFKSKNVIEHIIRRK